MNADEIIDKTNTGLLPVHSKANFDMKYVKDNKNNEETGAINTTTNINGDGLSVLSKENKEMKYQPKGANSPTTNTKYSVDKNSKGKYNREGVHSSFAKYNSDAEEIAYDDK